VGDIRGENQWRALQTRRSRRADGCAASSTSRSAACSSGALWLLFVLVLAAVAGFVLFVAWPAKSIPSYEPVDQYVYLDQGWGTSAKSPERQLYYYTPQGASLPQGALVTPLRYDWFVNLEMPLDNRRFARPEHMQRYRFIVDPKPTPANPDRLPLGFTRHYDPVLGENVLDLTCAACHSGEIHARKDGKTYAIRIDGGQAMHAFTDMERGAFGPTLVAAMIATYANPMKFDRFARKVIGTRYPEGKSYLHHELGQTIKAFATQGQNNPFLRLYPLREASAAPTRSGASPTPCSATTWSPATTRTRWRRSATRTCGTSGSSTGCSTTAR
jgi:hypothetical protein